MAPVFAQSLPDDVIRNIIDLLESDRVHLSACAQINRQFSSYARPRFFRNVHLQSSVTHASRITELDELVHANPSLLENTASLNLDLGDGHRWIFSRILTPPFRTSDPSSFTGLRQQRAGLDGAISSILLNGFGHGLARNLRVLVLSHYNFYPVSPVPELMTGWQTLFGVETLEKISMNDIADFPLALLGSVRSKALKEVGFLRVKLDRWDTKEVWSTQAARDSTPPGGVVKRLRPKVFSIRDCYSETIDPIIACAMNPNSFLDLSRVEQLTVHSCLAVQTPSYNKLIKAVISCSSVLTHLIWMSSSQHQARDLEVTAADFTRFKKVDLIFVDGFGGFPQLLTEIRDLLRAASGPPLPASELASTPPTSAPQSQSALEELRLCFDLENLTMHATPESITPAGKVAVDSNAHALSPNSGSGGSDMDTARSDVVCCHRSPSIPSATSTSKFLNQITPSAPSLYYAPIKYYWKLEEGDMQLLKEIDGMLAGSHLVHAGQDQEESLSSTEGHLTNPCIQVFEPSSTAKAGSGIFPNFKKLSTTCVYNSALSFLLDDSKAMDVYEALKMLVSGRLPRVEKEGKMYFAYEKI